MPRCKEMVSDPNFVVVTMERQDAEFAALILREIFEAVSEGESWPAADAEDEFRNELATAVFEIFTHIHGGLAEEMAPVDPVVLAILTELYRDDYNVGPGHNYDTTKAMLDDVFRRKRDAPARIATHLEASILRAEARLGMASLVTQLIQAMDDPGFADGGGLE